VKWKEFLARFRLHARLQTTEAHPPRNIVTTQVNIGSAGVRIFGTNWGTVREDYSTGWHCVGVFFFRHEPWPVRAPIAGAKMHCGPSAIANQMICFALALVEWPPSDLERAAFWV